MDTFDTQRLIEFDFLRATEIAALNCMRWVGKGDKEAADAAACDAIRGMFDITDISGEVVIGEGIKDDAPGIFKGEKLGAPNHPHPHMPDSALGNRVLGLVAAFIDRIRDSSREATTG